MIPRVGAIAARLSRSLMPDPFVFALLLTALTFGLCWAFTDRGPLELIRFWGDESKGMWSLLGFAFQMCLILVTGHALASAPLTRRLIGRLAELPDTTARAAALVAAVSMAAALFNWGLGLIVGALLAREVGVRARTAGRRIHYPLVVAAGYLGLLVWHGGLSGSAPLLMTRFDERMITSVGEANALAIGPLPLDRTIFSPLNLLVGTLALGVVPLIVGSLAPRDETAFEQAPDAVMPGKTIPGIVSPGGGDGEALEAGTAPPPTLADRLDASFVLALLGVVPAAVVLGVFVREQGITRLGLNQVNTLFLGLGLLLHGSPRAYVAAIGDAARGTAGILLQFPFYFGIMGMMQQSGLAGQIASGLAEHSNATLYPVVTFLGAGLVNLFVPSGGGQWAVQGQIVMEGALRLGVAPERALLALCYGDQWTNMLQPFWALPLLGITGLRARDIIGYTVVVMVMASPLFILPLLIS